MATASPCAQDFVEHTKHMFVDVAQGGDIARGYRPARRAVFRKVHGIVKGVLALDPSRPGWTRQGIFANDTQFACWARFSSDVGPTEPDSGNGTIGFGIKLFGTSAPTLAEIDPDAPTADLLFQNHDVFFVDTGMDMCVFTDLALAGRDSEWFAQHPETKQILDDMTKREESAVTATYWSTLPYRCGPDVAVKYRLRPLATGASSAPDSDPNRLRSDLHARLLAAPASFVLELQTPLPGTSLPIDRATQRWEEAAAPFVAIGTLELSCQDVNAEGQESYGDNLAFSPWRVPEANAPLGTIAASRRRAYPASAAARHQVNGIPEAEPHTPRA
ncbi:MAG: hypothetical protein WC729_14450 [Sphingomonas sp.]|uniref:hypothetical protein n=1 Tax=Sphingomonas sp. TaxID=28214 RepID=UPI0035694B18